MKVKIAYGTLFPMENLLKFYKPTFPMELMDGDIKEFADKLREQFISKMKYRGGRKKTVISDFNWIVDNLLKEFTNAKRTHKIYTCR